MTSRKRRTDDERPIFESIRKPTAPPTRSFGTRKPESKARPSERKIKHKQRTEADE